MSDAIRRRLALAAAVLLACILLARDSPRELLRRIRSVSRFAPRELATRRLGGSSAAFDRRFFQFVESARRVLPRGTPGVALDLAAPGERHLYLASYTLAPVPVLLSSDSSPPGWAVAAYGGVAPSGSHLVARLPEGDVYLPAFANRPARP